MVEILGGLPLALTQAGAYLRSTKMPTHTWVKLYEDTWKSLMKSQNRLLSHGDALGSESALTAWNMSFTRVEAENRDAGFLLKLWAFLDCGDLSHALVAYATHLEEYVEVPGWLTSLANDELRFYDAVGVLSRYSLVDHFEYQINGQTISTYTMHPVVHKWCSQLCEDSERRTLIWLAAGLCAAAVDSISRGDSKLAMPWGHIALLFSSIEPLPPLPLVIEEKTFIQWTLHNICRMVSADATGTEVVLICRLANQYATEGKPELAEELYNHAHTVIRDVTSPCEGISRHVRLILLGMFHLGTVYRAQGGLIKAEGVYHQVLGEIRDAPVHDEKMYEAGIVHLLNLAAIHEDRGSLEKAAEMCCQVLQAIKDAPNLDEKMNLKYESTIVQLLHLAGIYQDRGNLEKSAEIYRQVVQAINDAHNLNEELNFYCKAGTSRLLNLGDIYKDRNDLEKAAEVYHQVLREIRDAPIRDEEMNLYYGMGTFQLLELADVHKVRGNLEKAEKLYGQVLLAIKCAPTCNEQMNLCYTAATACLLELGDVHKDHSKLERAKLLYDQVVWAAKNTPSCNDQLNTLHTAATLRLARLQVMQLLLP